MSTRALIIAGLAMFLMLNACLMALYLLMGSAPQVAEAETLPVLSTLPDFSLTTEQNTPLSKSDLAGKVWVADFFFSSCSGPCPIMTRNMAGVAERLKGTPDLAFVSISVDPETDTPEVLSRYGAKYGADPAQWHFLTGDLAAIQTLAVEGFMVGSVDDPIIHSPKFCLVDREGRVRGYYTGTDEAELVELMFDIDQLIEE